jgi:hypothetical protein
MAAPLLFLSHAGVDSDAALRLVEQIEATPTARDHGLKVWIDKRDLRAGRDWQGQLEDAIQTRSTAFAVLLGQNGVINWVDREVRLGLTRAAPGNGSVRYPFIPILSEGSGGAAALPGFASLYQGVGDATRDAGELQKLVEAALDLGRSPPVVTEPFRGLRPFEEEHHHLFFGRKGETDELIELLRRKRLLMIVGDSGSGKSSLAKAGLAYRFRGGALEDLSRTEPDTRVWHVIETRPLATPFAKLADNVAELARQLGRSAADQENYRERIRSRDAQRVRDALKDASPPRAEILLLVDQFEELFTLAAADDRERFITLLVELADGTLGPEAIRVVLTMRSDYYNLSFPYKAFYALVEGGERAAKFRLKRINPDGLRECVQGPLELAGLPRTSTQVLTDRIVQDVGDEPSNLALLETALDQAWKRRTEHGDDLVAAYLRVGGVAGALANLAETVFDKLTPDEQQLAEALFLRAVRLGDTGGATRRIVHEDELSNAAMELAAKLSRDEGGRLLFIRGETGQRTIEVAHEALVTQWPRYQTWLQQVASLKRIHEALIERARRWRTAKERWRTLILSERGRLLLTGGDLEEAKRLLAGGSHLLSADERALVRASRMRRVVNLAAVAAFSLPLGASYVAILVGPLMSGISRQHLIDIVGAALSAALIILFGIMLGGGLLLIFARSVRLLLNVIPRDGLRIRRRMAR